MQESEFTGCVNKVQGSTQIAKQNVIHKESKFVQARPGNVELRRGHAQFGRLAREREREIQTGGSLNFLNRDNRGQNSNFPNYQNSRSVDASGCFRYDEFGKGA
jgi:hypothetical protein